VARDRQRAKQRQAERRAARLERAGSAPSADGPRAPAKPERSEPTEALPVEIGGDAAEAAALAAGAPPPDIGRSDRGIEPPPAEEAELLDGELDEEFEGDEEPTDFEEQEVAAGPTRRRRDAEATHDRRRGKVLTFLANVWAELQRVQWPDRAAITSLTGIVLVFVLIAGGYLGLLDAIFSRVIQAIL
jgi:preprotein translocase subunit SecE